MSDNFLIIVPQDPDYLPALEVQQVVSEIVGSLAPDADEIAIDASENIMFFDAGVNCERISCPHCRSELDVQWWLDQMDKNYDGQGFQLELCALPCCGSNAALNELIYDWPQAFGKFSCTIRNPKASSFSETEIDALTKIIGMPIILVRRHL